MRMPWKQFNFTHEYILKVGKEQAIRESYELITMCTDNCLGPEHIRILDGEVEYTTRMWAIVVPDDESTRYIFHKSFQPGPDSKIYDWNTKYISS